MQTLNYPKKKLFFMANYIFTFTLLIAGSILVALGLFDWAIWLGILALWSMGNYLASKIDELDKKIDGLKQ
jgi:uncharacterized membrane protein YfcA